MRSKKRLVYVAATIATMAVFLPFQTQPWSIYAAAWVGYTILVFGLRRVSVPRSVSGDENAKPASAMALTHLTFLLVVAGWVWLCLVLKPYLPYFLTMEDTSRPYFGLAFVGILGLMGLEMVEQRWLRPERGMDADTPERFSAQQSTTAKK